MEEQWWASHLARDGLVRENGSSVDTRVRATGRLRVLMQSDAAL